MTQKVRRPLDPDLSSSMGMSQGVEEEFCDGANSEGDETDSWL